MTKYLSLTYLKAHVALVGGALTWYLASYPHGAGAHYVALAVGVLTALGVGVADNKSEDEVLDDVADVADHVFPEDSTDRSTLDDPEGTPEDDPESPAPAAATS